MALTRDQFEDLLEYLREHPEARDELRPVVLGPVHDAVPSRMDRVEAALDRLTIDIAEMRAHGREVDERIAENGAHIRAVTARMDEQTAKLDANNRALADIVVDIRKSNETLENQGRRLERYTQSEGRLLEQAYVQNSTNWFNTRLERARRAFIREIPEVKSALQTGQMSRTELEDISRLDLVVGGLNVVSGEREYIALEVSNTLDDSDIQRVARRASLLRRTGLQVEAIAGGYFISDQTRRYAESLGVGIDLREPPR
jgi:chromosome segregation ATPase